MSRQRRHGRPIRFWQMREVTDRRGNKVLAADPDSVIETTAWGIPQRSSIASMAGQQQINVIRVGVTRDLPGVGSFSRAEWDGSVWDVAAPPAYHHGTRHVRHWSIDLRERPGGAAKDALPEVP
ncbi:hypothetical protein CLV30_106136 [Haloactinopolyspora alba]|uniref:Head-tail adaptor n=1 Tax=Haloactinopolyspora alba TaxID=648780 RepID=A0A2P8E3U2_9ACTN|nr:hypothetical protein [Haloactinopolyspora alba]PSL04131.1 hypothetical protein CLV30_106136 [Haloactinopolyspora alba]